MFFIGLIAFGFIFSVLVNGEKLQWPEGSFTLPASKDGCPSDDFVKVHLTVRLPLAQNNNMHRKEKKTGRMEWPRHHGYLDINTLSGEMNDHLEVSVGFCVWSIGQDSMEYITSSDMDSQYVSSENTRQEWPSGKYCILKTMHRKCPKGLVNGTREVLYLFILEDGDRYHEDEELPSIQRERNSSILEYCCAVHGNTSEHMILPSTESFLLFPLDGKRCQRVKDMYVYHDAFTWLAAEDTSLYVRDRKPVGYVDYLDKNRQIAFQACYYVPMNKTSLDFNPRVLAVEDVTNGTNLALELSPEPTPLKPSKRYMLYYIIPAIGLVVLVVFLCALHSIRRNKRRSYRTNSQGPLISSHESQRDNCFHREGKIVCNEYMQTDQNNPESNLSCLLNALLDEETKAKLQKVLIPITHLTIEENIGQGAFGKVFKGNYNEGQGKDRTVAVKCIKESCTNEDVKKIMKEALLMAELSHLNIISLIGVSIDKEFGLPILLIPYMENKDLQSYLRKFRYDEEFKDKPPTYEELLMFSLQIGRGMEYLSGQKIVHRDLATRNCMVGANLLVKVADFGLARDVYESSYYRQLWDTKLPVKWMALESLQDRIFTMQSDIWAYGVTIWEIFTLAKTPYPSLENSQTLSYVESGKRLEQPEKCPDFMYELMLKSWLPEPFERPSFKVIADSIENHLTEKLGYLSLDDCKSESIDCLPEYLEERSHLLEENDDKICKQEDIV